MDLSRLSIALVVTLHAAAFAQSSEQERPRTAEFNRPGSLAEEINTSVFLALGGLDFRNPEFIESSDSSVLLLAKMPDEWLVEAELGTLEFSLDPHDPAITPAVNRAIEMKAGVGFSTEIAPWLEIACLGGINAIAHGGFDSGHPFYFGLYGGVTAVLRLGHGFALMLRETLCMMSNPTIAGERLGQLRETEIGVGWSF